jgi:hypothetical protein
LEEICEDKIQNEVMRGGDEIGEAINDQIDGGRLILIRALKNTACGARHWNGVEWGVG